VENIKLVCFPYAGGSARVYTEWKDMLSDKIELIPIELPGHGKRLKEDLLDSVEAMVEDAYVQIKDKMLDGQYAFFGHSLGALIAYELTSKIIDNKLSKPDYIFISGMGPPHCQPKEEKIHSLPEKEFKKRIAYYGGTPEEVFTDPQLKKLFIPILRSDFKAYEQYSYEERDKQAFAAKLIIFAGRNDEFANQLEEWQRYSKQKIDIYHFSGGHFFFQEEKNKDKMLKIITEYL